MAPEEGVAAAKNADERHGSDVGRPARLRVMHPDVATLLKGAYHRRTKKQAAPARAVEKEEVCQHARYDCAFEKEEVCQHARYDCAFEKEEEEAGFAPPRLVWAKVRGHPWWPAQVFDPADASALALGERRRRGSALVACFWERTFAWVVHDDDALLPFRDGFPNLAASHTRVRSGRTSLSRFASAVDAALGELARRVDVGLSCDCAIVAKKQPIDNAGVRRGAHGAVVDAAFTRDALKGEAFLGYLSALAVAPLAGADRLDLAIATAQLRAFTRWRGARGLPEYTYHDGIDQGATPTPPRRASGKRRRPTGGDVGEKWGMSRCSSCGTDDAKDLEDYEPSPQPLSPKKTTKMGKLMSRAAQQMSVSPANHRRAQRKTPQAANPSFLTRCTGAARHDHPPAAKLHNGGLLKDEPLLAGLVLSFAGKNTVPPTSELVKIFSQFGPVIEARAESSSVAVVVFKKTVDAETAFSGTAKIGILIDNLVSFRLSYSLSAAAPTDGKDHLPVEDVL